MKTAAQAPAGFNKTDVIWLAVIGMATAVTAALVSTSAGQVVAGAQPFAVSVKAKAPGVDRMAAEPLAFSARALQPVDPGQTALPPDPVKTSHLNVPPLDAQRFLLAGVVDLEAEPGQGIALISVDRQPAQPFSIGEQVAHGHSLQSVSAGQVVLAQSAGLTVKLGLSFPGASSSGQAMIASAASPPSNSSNSDVQVSAMSPESSLGAAAAVEYSGPPARADSRYRK